MIIPEAGPESTGESRSASAEVCWTWAPPCRAQRTSSQFCEGSSVPPRRFPTSPCTQALPGLSRALSPAIVHLFREVRDQQSPDYPAFFITVLTLMPTDFRSTNMHTTSTSLTPWRVYRLASQSFIHLHLPSSPPVPFPNTIPSFISSSLQSRNLIIQLANYPPNLSHSQPAILL